MRRARALALAALLGCGGAPKDTGAPAAPADPGSESEPAEGEATDPELARVRAVEGSINELSAAMHGCWGEAVADELGAEGEVVLEVAIGAGGAADAVEVVRDTTDSATLTECLVELWEGHVWPAGSFSAGEVVQLPPLRFVAEERQFAVAAEHVTPREVGEGVTARLVLREANTGNGDASIATVRLEPDARLPLPTGPNSATLVFALSGEGMLQARGPRARGEPIRRRDAAYAPPGRKLIMTAGDEGLELLVAYAAAGPEVHFLGRSASASSARKDASIIRGEGLPSYELAAGLGEVTIYADEESVGDGSASLGVLVARPGMVVPPHSHEDASEYLFLLSGRGSMKAGDEQLEVTAGMGVQVPRGVEHAFEVEGDEPVEAIQIYAPAGPEQRFKN